MKVRDLSFGTVFKICFAVGGCFWLGLSVLGGLLAVLSPTSVTINGKVAQTVAEALMIVPFAIVFGLVASAVVGVLGTLVFKLVSRYLPLGDVRVSKMPGSGTQP